MPSSSSTRYFEEHAVTLSASPEFFDDWVQHRRSGIGGSDAGAIMGVDPYRTPLDVYKSKFEEPTRTANGTLQEAAHWGIEMEDLVATEFSRQAGYKVENPSLMLRSRKYPFMLATLDRVALDPEGNRPPAVLEVKTRSVFKRKEYSQDPLAIEPKVLMQCHHYMIVTGTDHCHLAVLFGGQTFEWYFIKRDPTLVDRLIEAETRLWECVQSRTPPKDARPTVPELAVDNSLRALLNKHAEVVALSEQVDKVRAQVERDLRGRLENYPHLLKWKTRRVLETPVLD